MKIFLPKEKLRESLYSFMRKCGYAPFKDSYVRKLSSSYYPRFHVYVDEVENDYILNLHLDQKKPTYLKGRSHSGEYDSEVVGDEAERIKRFFE